MALGCRADPFHSRHDRLPGGVGELCRRALRPTSPRRERCDTKRGGRAWRECPAARCTQGRQFSCVINFSRIWGWRYLRASVAGGHGVMSDSRVYTIRPCMGAFAPGADWDAPHWRDVETESIASFPWSKGGFLPETRFKLQYSCAALHVIFQVQDRYVRSVTTRYGGPVWRDSCVEFFFATGTTPDTGYFNVEVNCGGTSLMARQVGRDLGRLPIESREARRLRVAHTMPRVVDPEIAKPVTWVLEYAVPLDILTARASVLRPGPGASWLGNFYKCAEANSHPHWGSWAPIVAPTPDFHRPEFFGVLEFE